jgi:hypothetical protein
MVGNKKLEILDRITNKLKNLSLVYVEYLTLIFPSKTAVKWLIIMHYLTNMLLGSWKN